MLTASPVMSHSNYLLLLTTTELQLALIAVRVAVSATHGLVVFGTRRAFTHRFPVAHFTSGTVVAHVFPARISIFCAKKSHCHARFSRHNIDSMADLGKRVDMDL